MKTNIFFNKVHQPIFELQTSWSILKQGHLEYCHVLHQGNFLKTVLGLRIATNHNVQFQSFFPVCCLKQNVQDDHDCVNSKAVDAHKFGKFIHWFFRGWKSGNCSAIASFHAGFLKCSNLNSNISFPVLHEL